MEFKRMLESVRFGQITPEVTKMIRSRIGAQLENPNGIIPTQLLTHKKDVDAINQRELGRLQGRAREYIASDSGVSPEAMRQNASSCPARSRLKLKLGAQVTLLKNICVQEGLVNGGRGVVVRFEAGSNLPVVKFVNGFERSIGLAVYNYKVGGMLV